jgi:hypothetical protein
MIHLATKTIQAIESAITADNGNAYRGWLGRVIPHLPDAFREDEDDGFRSHLGASVVGIPCERELWYKFRWAAIKEKEGKQVETPTQGKARMIRLWNRGHLEEGRFIAMLLLIGAQVYQQDANGKQYRISEYGGHYSGSSDGLLWGVPELPGMYCGGEFKTHNDDSFKKLKKDGVKESKPEHYIQMNVYMRGFGLKACLYLAVNKDTDELHGEIVFYDEAAALRASQRAARVIFGTRPSRIRNASPGLFICKFCPATNVCWGATDALRNCRTCDASEPAPDGTWKCKRFGVPLDKDAQLLGCAEYRRMPQMEYGQ